MFGNRCIFEKRVTMARLLQGMTQVELLAKLQLTVIYMSVSARSLLPEDRKRPVTDIELNALSAILNVSLNWL